MVNGFTNTYNDRIRQTIVFKFKDFGEFLGTRQLGAQARERLLPLIKDNNKIILDFEGVSVVSNSFADECLGKLLLTMPFDVLKSHTTFRSLNDLDRRSISIALWRRLNSLK